MPKHHSPRRDTEWSRAMLSKKTFKKITKLEAQIPMYIGLRNDADADKIREQVKAMEDKSKAENGF